MTLHASHSQTLLDGLAELLHKVTNEVICLCTINFYKCFIRGVSLFSEPLKDCCETAHQNLFLNHILSISCYFYLIVVLKRHFFKHFVCILSDGSHRIKHLCKSVVKFNHSPIMCLSADQNS